MKTESETEPFHSYLIQVESDHCHQSLGSLSHATNASLYRVRVLPCLFLAWSVTF